jgi:uncharacterized protein DUF6498
VPLPAWKRVIPSAENQTSIAGAWLWTLVYCGFCFPMFWYALTKWRELVPILISGFFAVWGVVYFFATLFTTLEKRKFGDVRVTLDGAAPTLGGVLAGRIQLPRAAAAARHIRAELVCIEEVLSQDAKGRTARSEKRVWYRELPFPVRREGARNVAAFQLRIADEPVIERGVAYKWQLKITADVPGVDLSRSFPVEVAQRPAEVPASATAAPIAPAPAAVPAFAPAPAIQREKQSAPPPPEVLIDEPPSLSTASGWALVAANLVPLAGVAFGGWKVADVVLLYWLENVLIGLMNALRIACADPQHLVSSRHGGTGLKPGELPIAKLVLIGFFFVHYGAFCAAHGTVLAEIFAPRGPFGQRPGIGALLADMLSEPAVLVSVLFLLGSHLVSFRVNYIGREEYRHVDIAGLMLQPYRRILVVHLFILFGGFALAATNTPAAGIAVFIAIKTAIDFNMHLRERRRLA